MHAKELYAATNLLTSQIYKYINVKNIDSIEAIMLWCFTQCMQNYKTYPIDQLLDIKFIKKWWDE